MTDTLAGEETVAVEVVQESYFFLSKSVIKSGNLIVS